MDEHAILIAQWLKRNKEIENLNLVDVCNCSGELIKRTLTIDNQGDIIEDPIHTPFFGHRLKYLR